jgi:hypothetical protein
MTSGRRFYFKRKRKDIGAAMVATEFSSEKQQGYRYWCLRQYRFFIMVALDLSGSFDLQTIPGMTDEMT